MATGTELTERQREILDVIVRWIDARGMPPVWRELMREVGITSPNGIRCHLDGMKAKGYVDWNPRIARSLKVLKGGPPVCPHCNGTGHLKSGGTS